MLKISTISPQDPGSTSASNSPSNSTSHNCKVPAIKSDRMEKNERRNLTCAACGGLPARKHYGVQSCEGCKLFFRRSVREKSFPTPYDKCLHSNNCNVDHTVDKKCRSCRLNKCLQVGMNPEKVQKGRGKTAAVGTEETAAVGT